jgi:hypothetical protein
MLASFDEIFKSRVSKGMPAIHLEIENLILMEFVIANRKYERTYIFICHMDGLRPIRSPFSAAPARGNKACKICPFRLREEA